MKRSNPLSVTMTLPEMSWGTRYLLFQLAILPSLLSAVFSRLFPKAGSAVLNICYFCINFGAVIWIFRRFLWESLRQIPKKAVKILLFAALGFLAHKASQYLMGLAIDRLFPQFYNVNDAHVAAALQKEYLFMSLGAVVLVPLTEECLHRGLVFGMLRRRSPAAAYAVSVLLFSFIHVMNFVPFYEPVHLFVCFIQYIPAGLVFAWAYEKADSIFAPILIHTLINATGILFVR